MSHSSFYLNNAEYANFLQNQQPAFFGKYVEALKPGSKSGSILDVGCGVGQVVSQLNAAGFSAQGVDICGPAVALAQAAKLPCRVYDGTTLPFESNHFDAIGAFNVLEHVENPIALIKEMVRVAKPNGKLVISSPNFLRVLGFRDYHPKMRGVKNKIQNALRLLRKYYEMQTRPDTVRFDALTPVVRTPIQPDDDAITATNSLEFAFQLKQAGCRIVSISCTDRFVPGPVEFVLNATPLKFLMFNSFVVAQKMDLREGGNPHD